MSTLVSELKRLIQFISRKPAENHRTAGRSYPKPADTPRMDDSAADQKKQSPSPVGASRKKLKNRTDAAQSLPTGSGLSPGRGTTRNGVRILDGTEDLAQLFGNETDKGNLPAGHKLSGSHKRKPARSAAVSTSGKTSTVPAAKKPRRPHVNRNGIPVFSRDDDLQAMITADRLETEAESSKKVFKTEPPARKGKSSTGLAARNTISKTKSLDRNGLPILDRDSDLYRAFGVRGNATASEENFSELLEQSLAGKSRQAMWKEKRDTVQPKRPMSTKRRIKRYPPPQSQLDLHGNTAAEAEQETASCIKAAKANGIFTLRIIVGKGLHSESGAVLPDVVEDVLVKLKREGIVLTFEWEHRLKSKSGSVIVYLVQYP